MHKGARKGLLAVITTAIAGLGIAPLAQAQTNDEIRIGEINSYKIFPAFLEPYKNGMLLAAEQANQDGGINGRKLTIITRDDAGNQGNAIKEAQALISRDKVHALTGGFLSNIGLALADFAAHKKVFYLASEPLTDKLVWADGNDYTYRLRASTYMQVAMLVPEAVKLNKKRWALVYPNYEYGQSAVATFKTLMKQAQPDVEFVADQATPLNKVDAGSVIQALGDARPDAIFNVLFGPDITKFVRAGTTRKFFETIPVVSLLTGEPEYLDTLGADTPKGWIVTGYPWQFIDTPEHKAFIDAYQKRFNDYPRLGSIVGYMAIKSLAEGFRKAGTTDTQALTKAFSGLEVVSPFGPISYRPQDHQSTLGAYVGKLDVKDGRGIMTDIKYVDGATVQPDDAQVAKMRPAK
ncbi:ABC transporter substrate-binding protein [Advenella kashmirensis W13003]|uniref:ABC transporter substrate-binding protein n=1 Tax=Advenella kashmirensis W13003 TaxID=1424334 RepID=V8QR33_9BURK|nr:ABC transporter substrate-binding protein [Advenella kashmirensis]ETF01803.1 ABC transporter substrate-binding protein [Advenella kashmirensis W13003]